MNTNMYYLEPRRPLLELHLPVELHRGGHDDEVRAPHLLLHREVRQQGDRHDRLAQPHLVREDAVELPRAVIFIPIPLPKRVLQTSYCTHFFYRNALQAVLCPGMGMNVAARSCRAARRASAGRRADTRGSGDAAGAKAPGSAPGRRGRRARRLGFGCVCCNVC